MVLCRRFDIGIALVKMLQAEGQAFMLSVPYVSEEMREVAQPTIAE